MRLMPRDKTRALMTDRDRQCAMLRPRAYHYCRHGAAALRQRCIMPRQLRENMLRHALWLACHTAHVRIRGASVVLRGSGVFVCRAAHADILLNVAMRYISFAIICIREVAATFARLCRTRGARRAARSACQRILVNDPLYYDFEVAALRCCYARLPLLLLRWREDADARDRVAMLCHAHDATRPFAIRCYADDGTRAYAAR